MMTQLKRKTAWLKGLNGEFKVRFHLLQAALHEIPLSDVVFNATAGVGLENYRSMNKERVSAGTEISREVDIYARSKQEHGCDLVIEVKNWEKTVGDKEVEAFLELKAMVEKNASNRTAYLLYSENGFTPEQEAMLEAAGAMYSTSARLTAYEADLDA